MGIGLRHLYYEQGIGQILQLLKHIRAGSKLGTFLLIGLDWIQLHAGVSYAILVKPTPKLAHLEPGWFSSLRQFLGSIDASIYIPTSVLPRPLRFHDCILMDDVLSNVFSNSVTKKINLCRLFLQVELLSEICSPTGDCILTGIWRGKRPLSQGQLSLASTGPTPQSLLAHMATVRRTCLPTPLLPNCNLPQHRPATRTASWPMDRQTASRHSTLAHLPF